jgi:hypothetical protein
LLKWLVVNTRFQAPPGRVQTAPEMLTSTPADWADDLAACERLIVRVASEDTSAVHPAFGPLDPQEWGKVCWKHLDHHFRQFGV